MIVNALNEAAGIKEMGPTHFLFKTDWKETIWRKKIVKAANRYLDYADRDYLNKTIKYIAHLEYSDFTVDFSSIDLKDECKRVIATNIELCNKFNLDISTVEKRITLLIISKVTILSRERHNAQVHPPEDT